MIIRVAHLAIAAATALTIATPARAEITGNPNDAPGTFQVGPWKGQCLRAGFLSGSEFELCGATLAGDAPIKLEIRRTVKALTVKIRETGCKRGTFSATMTPAALTAKNRAARLYAIIGQLFGRQAKVCGNEADISDPVTREDLADILKATDGLEF